VEWVKELAMKVQTLATTNMFATTLKKVEILSDQSAMYKSNCLLTKSNLLFHLIHFKNLLKVQSSCHKHIFLSTNNGPII
jgi:hypothetical protein